jgi:hypothetical protein
MALLTIIEWLTLLAFIGLHLMITKYHHFNLTWMNQNSKMIR